jgi:hypothetical protein
MKKIISVKDNKLVMFPQMCDGQHCECTDILTRTTAALDKSVEEDLKVADPDEKAAAKILDPEETQGNAHTNRDD